MVLNELQTIEKRLALRGIDPVTFLGAQDANLHLLETELDARLVVRGQEIIIKGLPEQVERAERIISELIYLANRNGRVIPQDIETVFRVSEQGGAASEAAADAESVLVYTKGGVVKPRTVGQEEYAASARKNDIVFAIGPAGTGKTFLAVAMAVAALRDHMVDRLILCRPAVEAGESLGFLPGDFREKVDPYLRPLYDALHDMIPGDKLRRLIETRVVEIVPLAYMRGRTLNNCFVILDEAQNTTAAQMKMFLTRLGVNSRAIVTGDITQIDLPETAVSGLVQIQSILKGIEGIGFCYLTDRDVVRHQLVRQIIKAYENLQQSEANSSQESDEGKLRQGTRKKRRN
jgi:phosphate starvation-inducible protein PhoH and related proteins